MPETGDKMTKALVKVQSELPEISKDGEADAGKFSYKYATLPEIFRKIKPVLHENGFVLTQTSGEGHLITTLWHESGKCLTSKIEMPSPRSLSPQDYGKAHSYFRRYEVNGMLALAPDEDTDAAGVDAPETPQDVPREPLDDEADAKYHDAVSGLMARGVDALRATEKLDRETAWAEMESRKLTVLGHEGYESEDEITHRQARVEFYSALEKTVKAIEDKAGGGE